MQHLRSSSSKDFRPRTPWRSDPHESEGEKGGEESHKAEYLRLRVDPRENRDTHDGKQAGNEGCEKWGETKHAAHGVSIHSQSHLRVEFRGLVCIFS